MQIATARLIIDRSGSDVPLEGVTPPEVKVLSLIHQDRAMRCPVTDIKVTGEVPGGRQELERLRRKYSKPEGMNVKPEHDPVRTLFPGDSPTLPETFDQVVPSEAEAES